MTYFGQEFASPQEALEHYGVKGMKWGVRKRDDTGGERSAGAKELDRLDVFAAKHPEVILEQAGVAKNPNYERNRKILIGAGVGLGIAALAAGTYYYSQQQSAQPGNNADLFTSRFQLGLKNQIGKKLPPLDTLDDNDVTLPKSTIFRRVAGSANENIPDSHLYVSHLDEDSDRYVGAFSSVVKGRAGAAYLSEMTMNTSVSSPSLRKRVDIMKGMLKEVDTDPSSLTEGMTFREVLTESTAASRSKLFGGNEADIERRLSSLSDDDFVRETYGTFVNQMGGQINNPQYRVSHTTSYLDKIRNMGYNALVDDANVGVLAQSPMMLLTPNTSIAGRTSRAITDSDVKSARDRIKLLRDEDALIRHSDLPVSQEEAIVHYGVKGMKWGVRKGEENAALGFGKKKAEPAVFNQPTIDGAKIGSPIKHIDKNIDGTTQDAAHQMAAALKDRYGYEVTALKAIPEERKFKHYLAYVEQKGHKDNSPEGTIHIQPRDMTAEMKKLEDKKWFGPECGNARALMTHECAHSMFHADTEVSGSLLKGYKVTAPHMAARDTALKAAVAAAKEDGIKSYKFTSKISGYANSSIFREEHEAEMFAQYHWSENPPRFIKVWGETLHKEMGADPTPFRKVVKNG